MQRVADNVKMDVTELAAASIKLVNLQMARAVDIVSLDAVSTDACSRLLSSEEQARCTAELAEQLGVNSIIIPPYPGLFVSPRLDVDRHEMTFT